jgi:hypothetical protein
MKLLRTVLMLVMVVLMTVMVCYAQVAKSGEGPDQGLVRAGHLKAKEMGFNPIPAFVNEKDHLMIVAGTSFTMEQGKFVLANNDMIINTGKRPLKAMNLVLQTGEYATIKDGKITKQPGKLTPSPQ